MEPTLARNGPAGTPESPVHVERDHLVAGRNASMRNVTYVDEKRRLLVVANETIAAHQLFEMIRRRVAAAPTEVLLVAPALTGRLQFWLSDEDAGDRAARERHELADWLLFVLAGVLAIGGTVMTASFVLAGMGETALVWWVIVGDLGLKIVAFVIIWVVFQRRARADRLDY